MERPYSAINSEFLTIILGLQEKLEQDRDEPDYSEEIQHLDALTKDAEELRQDRPMLWCQIKLTEICMRYLRQEQHQREPRLVKSRVKPKSERKIKSNKEAANLVGLERGSSEHGADTKANESTGAPQESVGTPVGDKGAFDTVIDGAQWRQRDSKSTPRLRPAFFSIRYFKSHQHNREARMRTQLKRWQIQKERHNYPSSDNWRKILRFLEGNTANEEPSLTKRQEEVRLPDGLMATFKDSAKKAIEEIQSQTGCHVELVSNAEEAPFNLGHEDSFSVLNLRGSWEENTAALKVLPSYIDIVSNTDFNTNDVLEQLSSQRVSPPSSLKKQTIDTNVDAQYWREQEEVTEVDVEQLEAALEQLTKPDEDVTFAVHNAWVEDQSRKDITQKFLHNRPSRITAPLIQGYVYHLTQPMPRLIRRQIFRNPLKSSQGYVQYVGKELVALLSEPQIVKCVPSLTIARVFRFLLKHNDFSTFRKVFRSLEIHGYPFTMVHYHVMLETAAKAADVHIFHYLLGLMHRAGLPFSAQTWVIFHDLMCRRFPLESSAVLEIMRKRNLLDNPEAARNVAQNSVVHELTAHLAFRHDMKSFFNFYDNRFGVSYGKTGQNWLSMDVANRMVKTLLEAGQTKKTFEVLEEAKKRDDNARIMINTFHHFLVGALRDGDASAAIALLQVFRVGGRRGLKPNAVTYAVLFNIAWKQKYYNMTRVLWRYACAAGHVPQIAEYRIWRSLINYGSEEENLARGHLWRNWVGKFAIGVRDGAFPAQPVETGTIQHLESFTRYKPSDAVKSAERIRARQELLANLAGHKFSDFQHPGHSPSANRVSRHTELKKLLHEDLQAVTKLIPTEPLASMLRKAWQMDCSWKEEGLGLPKGLDDTSQDDMFREMLRRGIQVPTKNGDFTVRGKKTIPLAAVKPDMKDLGL